MKSSWCFIFLFMAVSVPLFSQTADEKIASVYAKRALGFLPLRQREDFAQKALQFDEQSSDALLALALVERTAEKRIRLLDRAIEADKWRFATRNQAWEEYLRLLRQVGDLDFILEEIQQRAGKLIEEDPYVMATYVEALYALRGQEGAQQWIDKAYDLHFNYALFWPFFFEASKEDFYSFFNYLRQEGFRSIDAHMLEQFLRYLPTDAQKRQALLSFLLSLENVPKSPDLFIHLALEDLISQEETFDHLHQSSEGLFNLRLYQRFYEALRDPFLRRDFEVWLNSLEGTFFWSSKGSPFPDNWLTVRNERPVQWTRRFAADSVRVVGFSEQGISSYGNGHTFEFHYETYPYLVRVEQDLGEELVSFTLGKAGFPLPLFEETLYQVGVDNPFLLLSLELKEISSPYDVVSLDYYDTMYVRSADGKERKFLYQGGQLSRQWVLDPQKGWATTSFYQDGHLRKEQIDFDNDGQIELLIVIDPQTQQIYHLFDLDHDKLPEYLFLTNSERRIEHAYWGKQGEVLDPFLIRYPLFAGTVERLNSSTLDVLAFMRRFGFPEFDVDYETF